MEIDGETIETVTYFIFLSSKSLKMVTSAMKLKDFSSLEEKLMTNLDRILKSRHYFTDKDPSSQNYGFSSMYGCESWIIKKAENQRTDVFELWCWRRLLRVPWTARRSSQSILKEISPGYSLEGLMLKLWYFGHLVRRTDSLEKTLMLGKTRRKGWQRMRWLDGIIDSMDMSWSMLQVFMTDREAWSATTHGVTKSCTWPSDWTEVIHKEYKWGIYSMEWNN